MSVPKTIEWISQSRKRLVPGRIRMIDQTLLPNKLVFLEIADVKKVWHAIKTLQVRGAPAIGIAAAMGVAVAVQNSKAKSGMQLAREVCKATDYLATSRPTAVNLFWALNRIKKLANANTRLSPAELKELIASTAVAIRDEDAAMCRAIGQYGLKFLKDGYTVLTHCNAGSLATAEYGTALAPIYTAIERGMKIRVYADETRPLLQGARLTAWELQQAGIEVTLICDNMAAHVMKQRHVNAVFVGADRIAANGDTANKIGTYGVALLAKAHKIPFYVFAPTSTFDLSLKKGSEIPIEERPAGEITKGFGKCIAPKGIKVYAPAFDITPAELITAIVCEKGIAKPDFSKSLPGYVQA
ncbi:MAG: S-methyl-5-thioribose-1-phosphate isomerase [Kiritimatiellae bacterium]|nr:S-methyl-5-thioribose-1-phosphate isomerase [Kiritimatiellia bacterium]MDD5520393.1 S-methyl-5-thioribose-1-phosphate isomerase [Kiritimatiellia bacterium]